MNKKANTFKGQWDENIPAFIASKSGQDKFDLFMSLKHNINTLKICAILLHRFLGDYHERNRIYFSDVFKQLKQWLFGSYRTEHISALAYLALNKGFNMYKTLNSDTVFKDKLYKQELALFYPEGEYMCITTQTIDNPIYFTYKPRQIFLGNNRTQLQDITSTFYKIEEENENEQQHRREEEEEENNTIPSPKLIKDSIIQTVKLFEYMDRNFVKFPCDYCRNNLTMNDLGFTSCSHLCHKSCLGNGYNCYCCEMDNLKKSIIGSHNDTI